jgi:alkylated DNA repair dioxygenase AlkB
MCCIILRSCFSLNRLITIPLMKRKRKSDASHILLGTTKNPTRRYNLTKDGKSWVECFPLPGDERETRRRLMACKPLERGSVVMRGREVPLPRYQGIYGRAYTFSGKTHDVEAEMPLVIAEFLAWANTTKYVTDRADGFTFNNVVGNWYMNGHQYIGAHSDDERQLKVTALGETTILGASYGAARTIRFRPKRKEGAISKLDLVLEPGTGYVMGGTTQRTHTHEIVKVSGHKGETIPPRISLTARCFTGSDGKKPRKTIESGNYE